ncbi:MAG: TolC family protein [Verrucomicrobiaceae bacterium]|nr:MAG: TolC family protein [Verrucomicrobiaceae bacterium]
MPMRSLAVRIVSLDSQRTLRESQLENSRQLVEFTRKRLESAEAAAVDVLQLELDVRQLEAEVLQLTTERTTLVGELRPQLGIGPEDDPVIRGELPAPVRIPSPSGSLARPDLQAARANVDAARSAAALARAQKWEDIGVGIAAQTERGMDAPEGYERDQFIGFRLSVPLPLWNDNSGRVREADAAAARRVKEVEALTLTIRTEIEAARAEMATLAKLLETLNESLLPAATQIEDLLRISYTTGQAPLTDVLRARDRRLLLERQRIDALREYHLARVRYESAQGRTPAAKTTRKSK